METNIPDVYAAGDCAETRHRILRKNTYLPLGTVAHKQGRIAGENALGGSAEFDGTLGTQSVKIFDKVVARTGLNEKEARDAGFDPATADLETWDHKVYYPPAHKLYIRVTADRTTGRLLGAQMIGAYGTEVSKRIDIFAAALFHGATAREFCAYDLSYTPPLSSRGTRSRWPCKTWGKSSLANGFDRCYTPLTALRLVRYFHTYGQGLYSTGREAFCRQRHRITKRGGL